MTVRWGLAELRGLLEEISVKHPFIVASDRWSHLELPPAGRWREVPTDRIAGVAEAARGSDGLLAVGGGSAIDVAKAVSSVTGLRVVSVPTTYSGAECTRSFGIKDSARRVKGGGYDLGVPDDALSKVAELTATRPGALANPRPASHTQILELFRSIW